MILDLSRSVCQNSVQRRIPATGEVLPSALRHIRRELRLWLTENCCGIHALDQAPAEAPAIIHHPAEAPPDIILLEVSMLMLSQDITQALPALLTEAHPLTDHLLGAQDQADSSKEFLLM